MTQPNQSWAKEFDDKFPPSKLKTGISGGELFEIKSFIQSELADTYQKGLDDSPILQGKYYTEQERERICKLLNGMKDNRKMIDLRIERTEQEVFNQAITEAIKTIQDETHEKMD
jgi:hypothetical protein